MPKQEKEQIEKYLKILKKYNQYTGFYDISNRLMKKYNSNTFQKTTVCATAPILISYVLWVLQEAQRLKISNLYFLSRDGQILFKIAKKLCEKYNWDISCEYVYFSRKSLRMPIYYLNPEEGISYIFSKGSNMSLDLILERAGVTSIEKEKICHEIGVPVDNLKYIINKDEVSDLKEKLIKNQRFKDNIWKQAKASWELIKEYFYQEKFHEKKKAAIVDSGWIGSMQKNLVYLLKKAEIQIDLHGFYFGLFKSKKQLNRKYHAFYFQEMKEFYYGIFFNNNLFECLCAANHGMTIGYKKQDSMVTPIFKNHIPNPCIDLQQKICEEYAENVELVENSRMNLRKYIYEIIVLFMTSPSIEEIEEYGSINFCDDMTESYYCSLVNKMRISEYFRYLFVVQLLSKFIKLQELSPKLKSYWIWGTIAQFPQPIKNIYKIDQLLYQLLFWIKIHMGD